MRITIPTSAALLLLAAAPSAQTKPGLVALTAGTAGPQVIATMDESAPCSPRFRCTPAVNPVPAPAWAGGTAYDASRGGVWVTDGRLLACHDISGPAATVVCRVLCQPTPVPGLAANEWATGLAVNESTKTLYVSISDGVTNSLLQMRNTCPPTPFARCVITPPVVPAQIVAGLACAEAAGVLIYTGSFFGVPAPANVLYLARLGSPCTPYCYQPVPLCTVTAGMGPLTGAAVDECAYGLAASPWIRVWVTDGKTLEALRVNPATCQVASEYCCGNGFGDPFVGLCVVPSVATSMGAVCGAGACPACPTMRHSTIGDAAIGNPSFVLQLDNAPAASAAYLVLNVGPCTAPGVGSPPLCGPVLVPSPGTWIVLGPIGTGGGVGCTGSASVTLSVPLNIAFCGLVLSSQYVTLCGGVAGTSVSNCLTWMVSST